MQEENNMMDINACRLLFSNDIINQTAGLQWIIHVTVCKTLRAINLWHEFKIAKAQRGQYDMLGFGSNPITPVFAAWAGVRQTGSLSIRDKYLMFCILIFFYSFSSFFLLSSPFVFLIFLSSSPPNSPLPLLHLLPSTFPTASSYSLPPFLLPFYSPFTELLAANLALVTHWGARSLNTPTEQVRLKWPSDQRNHATNLKTLTIIPKS